MKKTIIAMLALSGVAFGTTADVLNKNLEEWIKYLEYEENGNYILTFAIASPPTGSSYDIVKLADAWSIWCQQGRYIGLDTKSNGEGVAADSGWLQDVQTNTYSGGITLGETEGWMHDSGENGRVNNAIVMLMPIQVNDEKGISLSIMTADWATSYVSTDIKAADNNTFLDLNDVRFGVDATNVMLTVDGSNYVDLSTSAPAIPEPTTATLSLLALAGLAARRRRK